MSDEQLTFYHVRTGDSGFGRMGVDLEKALKQQGMTVYGEIAGSPNIIDDPSVYLPFGPKLSEGLTNVVLWASVVPHVLGWMEGQVPILWTMFEANYLPAALTEGLDQFDTIIVPSTQNLEMFSEHHDNVKYVPLGIDPEQWSYVPRTEPTERFNFLVCGRGLRKGLDLAYNAFKKCFPDGSWGDGPEPWLTIKSPDPERFDEPRIQIINGQIPRAAERELYTQAHCLLAPSRGKGSASSLSRASLRGSRPS